MLIRVFKIIRKSQVVSLIRVGAKLCSRLDLQGKIWGTLIYCIGLCIPTGHQHNTELSCDIGLLFLCDCSPVCGSEDGISEINLINVLRSSTSRILQEDLLLIFFNLLSHSVEDPINYSRWSVMDAQMHIS